MKRKKQKKTKTSKKGRALTSARARARTKGAKKKTATRKRKPARKKTAELRTRRHRRRDGADLTYELDMSLNPPVFTSGPGDPTAYPTGDLTIFLKGESRKVTIKLIGETFTAHKPIKIEPFDKDGSLYNPPANNPAPHRSLTFHANVRAKAANPFNQGDKYTLYFAGGSKALDPDIQNPGGNPSTRW